MNKLPCLDRRHPCGARLLSATEVMTIRSVYRKGQQPSLYALSRVFGIGPSSMLKVVRGETYKDL